jgi:cysteine peptidase C11 family protein
MVFMVGGAELGPAIGRDQIELERVGSSADVNVITAVQKSSRSNTEWLEIQPLDADSKPTKSKKAGQSTTGDLNTRLQEFLEFVAKNYKAKNYALILWGHASGLGFGRLGPGSSEDLIRLTELSGLIRGFREARESHEKLEILGFCACALSKAEFALELRDDVDFLVSSQIGISTLMTWPFDQVVQRVLMSPSVPPETLATHIVRCFEESYEPPPVALTALDLKKSEELKTHVDELSIAILAALGEQGVPGRLNNLSVLHAFRKALEAYPYDLESLVDFFDFSAKLVEEDALEESVRDRARAILDQGARSFVVNNARSGPKLAALNGLSILAPDFDDPDWLETLERCSPKAGQMAWLWNSTHWIPMARTVYEFAVANPEFNE